MGSVPRAMLTGRRLASGKIWEQATRKSCKCCGELRPEGKKLSNQGLCMACSVSRLLNSFEGKGVCEHWTEGSALSRADYHLARIEQ